MVLLNVFGASTDWNFMEEGMVEEEEEEMVGEEEVEMEEDSGCQTSIALSSPELYIVQCTTRESKLFFLSTEI